MMPDWKLSTLLAKALEISKENEKITMNHIPGDENSYPDKIAY